MTLSAWRRKEGDYEVIKSVCTGGGNACNRSGCGVLLYLKDGKLIKIEGDREHPDNQGRLCVKALAAKHLVYHPERLQYPMKRVGKRGEGRFERISWNEAFDIIVQKLSEIKEKYGPEAVAFHSGTGRGLTAWVSKLCYSFGSPNWVTPGYECYFPKALAAGITFGTGPDPWVDFAHHFPNRYRDSRWRKPECLIVWGANPLPANHHMFGPWFVDLMRMGTKMITVDPRLTWIAYKSDLWLQIRPGTDAALALGMLHVIVKEGLYDKEFVESWTNAPFLVRTDTRTLLREAELTGKQSPNFVVWDLRTNDTAIWDVKELKYSKGDVKPALEGEQELKLAEGVSVKCKPAWQMLLERLEAYTPQAVSEITWIPADKIIEAARLFGRSKPAAIWWGVSLDQSTNSFQNNRLICLLVGLTGNFDIPGGWTSEKPRRDIITSADAWGFLDLPAPQRKKILNVSKYQLLAAGYFTGANHNDVWDAILTGRPYPVKAFVSLGGGCVLSQNENLRKVYEALTKVEFIVQSDLLPSPMTYVADIVLPAASWVERDNLTCWWSPLNCHNKAVQIGEVKSDIEIICELGNRLCPDKWPWKTPEELFDFCLSALGINFKQLREKAPLYLPFLYKKFEKGLERPDRKPGFNTPSGKVEIWASLAESKGVDPLPSYIEPPQSPYSTPELAKEYPLILTTGGRIWGFFHSEGRQIPWMRELHPDPLVEIHPTTAEKYGIKDGDWVYVETPTGKCKMKAKLFLGIHPSVVRAEHNWWYPEKLGKEPIEKVLEPNVNWCTNAQYYDSAIGSPQLRGLLCKVYKC